MLLTSSLLAASLGCAGRSPKGAHAQAPQQKLEENLCKIAEKLERAKATLEAVAEARMAILELVPEVPDAASPPDKEKEPPAPRPRPPVPRARLERVRVELSEVRSELAARRYRFTPQVIELRRLEEQLARELQDAPR